MTETLIPLQHQRAMGPRLTLIAFASLCCCITVSLAHPVREPRLVRLIPQSIGSQGGLEKRFRAVRQAFQDNGSSLKDLPRCRQRALDRAMEIDETCLSCTTNVETGQVSECPEGCCRTFSITEDLETAHFITCYKGCCTRSVAVLSDSSDREAGLLNFEGVFSVNNDITLNEITALGQCMVEDGSSKGCGSSCAVFTPKSTRCSNVESFQVPAFEKSFVAPPCAEAEDNSGSKGPGDDSASSSTGVTGGGDSGAAGDIGNEGNLDGDDGLPTDGGDKGDRDGNRADNEDSDATGPVNDEDEAENIDGAGPTGPIDGGGVRGDDDEELEPSATEEVEESSPEETDDGFGGTVQDGEEPIETTAEESADDGTETDEPVCFPAEATVELVNGHKKRMEDLRTGDLVLVRRGTYSRVFGFTHENKNYHGGFVELRTTSGHILRLTRGHYMYSDGVIRRAKDVRIGHTVKLGNDGTSEVTEIGEWTGYGLFNPQTVDGDIVVDGVVVSTYTEAIDAGMAHALLTPVRAISEWVDVSALLNRTTTAFRRARKAMVVTTY